MAAPPPKYRQIADELSARIKSGQYAPGDRLPSRADLMAAHSVVLGTVAKAVDVLEGAGLVYSEQGRGTFVCDPLPGEEARASHEAVGEQIADLRQEVARLAELADTDDLRAAVGRMEANLIDLYGKLGYAYPEGGSHDAAEAAPRRARGKR